MSINEDIYKIFKNTKGLILPNTIKWAIYLGGSKSIGLDNYRSDFDLIIYIESETTLTQQQKNQLENLIYSQLNWTEIWDKTKIKWDIKIRFLDRNFSYFLDPHSIHLLGEDLQININYNLFSQKNYLNNIKYIEVLLIQSKGHPITNWTKHSYLLYLLVNMYINKSTDITEEMYSTAKQIRATKSISKELFEDILKKYAYIKETYNYLLT